MTTWYVAKLTWNEIKTVEVERETAQCVWVYLYGRKEPIRQNKDGDYEAYRPTWEEARAVLLAKREADLVAARRRLQQAQDALGNVKGMKPPAA